MKHLEPNQFDSLLSSGEKVLVMFYADWCPFCQRFKPVFESAITTKSTSNGYKFYESKVNDDDNPLWDRFSITLIAFDKGKIISRRDAKIGVVLTNQILILCFMRLFNIELRLACIGLITDDQEKSDQLVRWKEMVPTSLPKGA